MTPPKFFGSHYYAGDQHRHRSGGINNSGQVAGIVYNNTTGQEQAFIGTAAGTTSIPVPAGWSIATGFGINDAGQVAGTVAGGPAQQAFIGTNAGSAAIPLPTGWFEAFGYGINNSGEVVGTVSRGPAEQAFIGTTAGSTAIPLPAGWAYAQGYGINNSGQIAGFVNNGGTTFQAQAFIGTAAASVAIPLPVGWSYAFAGTGPINCCDTNVINDSGQVVGGGSGPPPYPGLGGFIWDPTNGARDLNTLVPAGWTIAAAYGINHKGQIVGTGFNSSMGFSGTVVLTPGATPGATCVDSNGQILPLAYTVPNVQPQQQLPDRCWATQGGIMASWKTGTHFSGSDAVFLADKNAGSNEFLDLFLHANNGINYSQYNDFLVQLGISYIVPGTPSACDISLRLRQIDNRTGGPMTVVTHTLQMGRTTSMPKCW